MKLSQLNAFRAIVECQTVTAAAERLNLSQPAASRLLAALEQRLGFQLFIRQGNRLLLSDDGEAFYLEVIRAFEAFSGLDHTASSIRANRFGSLNVAAMPLLSNAFLPRTLARFLHQTSQMKVALKTYRSEDVIRRVQSQTTDIGFAFIDEPLPGVRAQRVKCESVCLLPAGSSLAKKSHIDLDDLAELPLIRHEKDVSQRQFDALLRRYQLNMTERIEVSLATTAAALVREGLGMAITDPFTARIANEYKEVIERPLAFSLPFEFEVLYPALRPLNRHAQRFIKHFTDLAEDMEIVMSIGTIRDLSEQK
ncbi:LysR family transcriptional regulator [Oceanisphaera pacifica]|uniref:LysR family transcriptional regulator n=1 Tax=Oceanisphaera pacifica TaxID=2818389 RepID=A0ABS3NIE2_9GAMM|nr:LysR family transcriptional regulator [Oceanisphaera pacifica]MBO1520310.1 LysR family transcriptional regulator [Oceanisphaera pacifica]